MTTREDFKNPFTVEDAYRRLTHVLTSIEYKGNEPIGDYVTVTDFVFYPNNLKRSRFSVVAPDYGQESMQQGSLSFDALELLVGEKDFSLFLDWLHDLCEDFTVGDYTDGPVKYDYDTEKWEEDLI